MEEQTTLRIKIWAYKHPNFEEIIRKVIKNITNEYITEHLPNIRLPHKKRIYCILRSPHVDKDSREHFEIRIYSEFVDIRVSRNDFEKILDLMFELNLEPGVQCVMYKNK